MIKRLVLMLILSYSVVCAEGNLEGKIYLSHQEITIHNDQIFALLDGNWMFQKALYSDQNGIYIQPAMNYQPQSERSYDYWKCPGTLSNGELCKARNRYTRWECHFCGWTRYDWKNRQPIPVENITSSNPSEYRPLSSAFDL